MATPSARPTTNSRRRRLRGALAALAVALLLTAAAAVTSQAGAAPSGAHPVKPTIVLVHGAFADASGWAAVTRKLQHDGYTVLAPANPLQGLATDTTYLRDVLKTVSGPIVLVGHSYGGAVITDASAGNPNIAALVYINAYALDAGETAMQANSLGGAPPTPLLTSLKPIPMANGTVEVYIDPAKYHHVFAQDLSYRDTTVMATAQRPAALAALTDPSTTPGWKTIPTWYLASSHDRTISPVAELAMARRAHAHTVEIDSSHVAMISHPKAVTRLILAAARAD
jgi:pimeloyl-ACP methyl ester carboxylesterase